MEQPETGFVALCYQLLYIIVEPFVEPPTWIRGSKASHFYFCTEMTMPHGVVVIKCASRGFEWLGLPRLNYQLRYSREFFFLVDYSLPLAE